MADNQRTAPQLTGEDPGPPPIGLSDAADWSGLPHPISPIHGGLIAKETQTIPAPGANPARHETALFRWRPVRPSRVSCARASLWCKDA